ncbi:MAG: septum formation protein Maf [Anaerolineales bacterium]|nr:septum formation protein Maf [Anaerolineales bacterium]
MRPLLLASASPRRRQLLALAGWTFTTLAANADETPLPGEAPEAFVRRLSELKARSAAHAAPAGALVIGSDTTVVIDGQILNKPGDAAEARAMLTQLRGREHIVLTAITVLDTVTGQAFTDLARSRVPMRAYSAAELEAYVATGDPLDKAGAYAIQHPAFQPVDRAAFVDCFANVMGLPLCHLLRRLRRLGLDALTDLPAECQAFIPYACPVFERLLNEPV